MDKGKPINHTRLVVYWSLLLLVFVALTEEPAVDSVMVIQKEVVREQSVKESPRNEKRTTSQKISVNRATSKELQSIPGIGEVLAARIIASRSNQGPFNSVDDLQRVKGIGKKRCETLAHHVIIE